METPGSDNPMVKPFLEFWSRFAKESAGMPWTGMMSPTAMFNPLSAYREWEQRWMDTLSDSIEAYLRSPHFLEWMRHHSDFMVKSKQQADNVSQEFARNAGIPTASDISGLYERLQSFEDNLIRRLDKEVLQRLKPNGHGGNGTNGTVASRLDRIEAALKPARNGGGATHHGNGQEEDLSDRLERLESSLVAALERIEQRLDKVDGGGGRESAVENRPRAHSGAPRVRRPVKRAKAGAKAKINRDSKASKP